MAEGSSLSLFYLVGENDFWWVRARFEPQRHSSPTQHGCRSSLVVESALVAAPQLWDATITAIIQVRELTEPFNVCESDSESSLIIVFSSLEIHRHPGQPQSHICMTAQDKEKQLKVTVFFLPERASSGFDPKRPRQWEVGPFVQRVLEGGMAYLLSATFVPFSLVWWQASVCDREHISPWQLCIWHEINT